jgi:hypothetical protein
MTARAPATASRRRACVTHATRSPTFGGCSAAPASSRRTCLRAAPTAGSWRVFADLYPIETAGLVLIDTMGRDGRRRQLAIWPRSQAPEIRGELATTVIGGVDLAAGEALASRVSTLGEMPLAVITAGRQDNFPRTPARLGRALKRLWDRMQDELAGLSDNSVHVVALGSNHDVPSSRSGQPSVVIRALQAVVGAARDHARLPPCRRLFSGSADVRCRS